MLRYTSLYFIMLHYAVVTTYGAQRTLYYAGPY